MNTCLFLTFISYSIQSRIPFSDLDRVSRSWRCTLAFDEDQSLVGQVWLAENRNGCVVNLSNERIHVSVINPSVFMPSPLPSANLNTL